MRDILAQVEQELPSLLDLPDWNTLHVTYEPPEVRRLWRPWGDYRIFLHEILPCDPNLALYHPHPWPSIVKIVAAMGQYQMGIGYGAGLVPPPIAMTTWLQEGSAYEMLDRDAWHFVAPTAPVLSLMVTGLPWGREMPRSDHPRQPPLPAHEASRILDRFGRHYPHPLRYWSPELAMELAQLRFEGPIYYKARDLRPFESHAVEWVESRSPIDVARVEDWINRWYLVEIHLGKVGRPRYILQNPAGIPI